MPRGLPTDSLNSNRNPILKHPIWPIVVTVLQLKGIYRNILGFDLILVIPGRNDGSEPKSLQHVLALVVDALLQLTGREIYNDYTWAPLNVKLSILYTLVQLPGCEKCLTLQPRHRFGHIPVAQKKVFIARIHPSNWMYMDSNNFFTTWL